MWFVPAINGYKEIIILIHKHHQNVKFTPFYWTFRSKVGNTVSNTFRPALMSAVANKSS